MKMVRYQDKFWDNYFRYYDVLLELIPYQNLMRTLVSGLALNPADEVLDLGCGTGNIRYFTSTGNWTGIDNSEAALKRYTSKFSDANVVQHSITEGLPFADESFDKIVCNNVLYTLQREEWKELITEVRRVLKPEGRLVIANLNTDFSPSKIYREHIKQSIMDNGRLATVNQLVTLASPTVQMFRYNAKIKKDNTATIYAFLQQHEQKAVFEARGFRSLQPTEVVYSGCGVLDVFERG